MGEQRRAEGFRKRPERQSARPVPLPDKDLHVLYRFQQMSLERCGRHRFSLREGLTASDTVTHTTEAS